MRFRTLVGMSLVALSLVVCGVETASAHPYGPSPVRVERRYAFTIRTINGYVKRVVIWAPNLKIATDRLRVNHPYAKIIAVD
jgi:hypothetical protein